MTRDYFIRKDVWFVVKEIGIFICTDGLMKIDVRVCVSIGWLFLILIIGFKPNSGKFNTMDLKIGRLVLVKEVLEVELLIVVTYVFDGFNEFIVKMMLNFKCLLEEIIWDDRCFKLII